MKKYVTLYKEVGQTPLECAEKWRATQSPAYQEVPLAYAGRLDPMAEGRLLGLIGDECKKQERYHHLDKEYIFDVLLGAESDSGDVLGVITNAGGTNIDENVIRKKLRNMKGIISLPYPKFSAKTVQGKPLHTWTVEGRLDEIEIPLNTSHIHKLKLLDLRTKTKENIYQYVTGKIETIPKVTDERKALGNDFRRTDVRESWKEWYKTADDAYQIATIKCTASSGTYMRSLAEEIGKQLQTTGLAYSIKRTKIGHYRKIGRVGLWTRKY